MMKLQTPLVQNINGPSLLFSLCSLGVFDHVVILKCVGRDDEREQNKRLCGKTRGQSRFSQLKDEHNGGSLQRIQSRLVMN